MTYMVLSVVGMATICGVWTMTVSTITTTATCHSLSSMAWSVRLTTYCLLRLNQSPSWRVLKQLCSMALKVLRVLSWSPPSVVRWMVCRLLLMRILVSTLLRNSLSILVLQSIWRFITKHVWTTNLLQVPSTLSRTSIIMLLVRILTVTPMWTTILTSMSARLTTVQRVPWKSRVVVHVHTSIRTSTTIVMKICSTLVMPRITTPIASVYVVMLTW